MLAGIALLPPCLAAAACNPKDLQGPYAFQLSGQTTISGESQPATSLGRIVFDGAGGIAGTASSMFAGYLLGNPVTGSYEAHTDCSVSWSLQDDSGAYQHFSGVATPGAQTVEFRQTDPGGLRHGLLSKTSNACQAADLANKKYDFTLSGTTIPMDSAGGAGTPLSARGTMMADPNGNFKLSVQGNSGATDVTLTLDSDCTVEMELSLPAAHNESVTPMTLRGVLTRGGQQILAIQTDPGAMVSAKFTAR